MSFDFDAAVQAPHRMQPGLRRLAPGAQQLSPSVAPQRGVARHLREKLAVLGAFPAQALLCAPGFNALPALAALAAWAATEHPQAFVVDGERWHAPWLGWALDAGLQPLDTGSGWPEIGTLLRQLPPCWRRTALLSLAFEEDFAILDAGTGSLPWLAVALPSMWAPEAKIGRSFAEVHAPVADSQLIQGAAPQLLQLVTQGGRWERFVWTLSPHPRLHAHPQRVDPARWPTGLADDALAAQTWWRSERQTFIPVPPADLADPACPAGRQAVFTINVQVTPLVGALSGPAQAAQVHAALLSMSDAVLAYRGLGSARPPLLRWLARQAGASLARPA